MESQKTRSPRSSSAWLLQTFSGLAVIFLIGLHLIANHFIAAGGIRDYHDVVVYLSNPIVVVLEVLFLIVVTGHGLLGVRSILFDLGLSERLELFVSRALTVVGVLTIAYGLWLTWTIIH